MTFFLDYAYELGLLICLEKWAALVSDITQEL